MNKIAYVCKKILNESGDLTGYDVRYTTTSGVAPSSDHDVIYGAAIYKFKKAEMVDGSWVVVEDTAAKSAAEATTANVEARITTLASYADTIEADLDAATTIAGIKAVLKPVLKELLTNIYKD